MKFLTVNSFCPLCLCQWHRIGFGRKSCFTASHLFLVSLRTRSSKYLQRYSGKSSCNHHSSVKAIYIAYSECISVALVVQHALHVRHMVIYGLFGLNLFQNYLINGMIFEKKPLLNIRGLEL